jgi:hypothetical protein
MRRADSITAFNKDVNLLSGVPQRQATTTFNAALLDATHIVVEYSCLPGDQPKRFGNIVSIWENSQLRWGQPALTSSPVDKDEPTGDMIITLREGLPSKPPYVVAYGTSDSGTAYCAAQVVRPQNEPASVVETTEVSVPFVGNDSLLVNFKTPQGNRPKDNRNWIGLWIGQAAPYDQTNQISKFEVESNNAADSQAMNGLVLLFGTYYTLAYAIGPRPEDLAAWVTFKTKDFRFLTWLTNHAKRLIFRNPASRNAPGKRKGAP